MSYLMDWQLEPPSTTVGLLALLYAAGWRRRPRRRAAHRHAARRQAACFAAGVAALVLALNSPLAALDDQLFWVHMTQHVLLLVVAPPLLLLGRPGPTIWGTLPLPMRRAATQEVRRLAERAWARAAWRIATAPTTAQIAFVGTLALWHLPVLYDATLRSPALHLLEHQTFLASGLLLWSQLVDSPPLRSRLGYPARALHATVATAASWLLAIALALGSEPLYQG